LPKKKKSTKSKGAKSTEKVDKIAYLPITCDLEEALIVHTKLVQWAEEKHPILMSKELLPLTIKMFIKLYSIPEVMNDDIKKRVRAILSNKKYIKAVKITESEQSVLDSLTSDDWFKSFFPTDYSTKDSANFGFDDSNSSSTFDFSKLSFSDSSSNTFDFSSFWFS